LFLIPEESDPPQEIRATSRYLSAAPVPPTFVDAVVDPNVNALIAGVAIPRSHLPASAREQRDALVERASSEGPAALSARDKSLLLSDPLALSKLHFRVWTDPQAHAHWHALCSQDAQGGASQGSAAARTPLRQVARISLAPEV
jgi:membrane glycosyltransferase